MGILRWCAAMAAALFLPHAALAQPPSEADKAEVARIEGVLKQLHPQHGVIELPAAGATLNLGEAYYYLSAADSKLVLTQLWGNPPEVADGVLGMVIQSGISPYDAPWGAVITYMASGYVADKEAQTKDYDKVLKDLREGEDADNERRRKDGFPTLTLVGWAEPPAYDAQHNALIWARELASGDSHKHDVNYDIRLLGRKGVLSVNTIGKIETLPQIHKAAAELSRTAAFDPGLRYADYKDGVDQKAAFGLLGLITAGAGAVAVQKAGLIGVILLFAKKGIVIIAAAGASIAAWFRRRFGRKT